jgi:hypothetical protein
MRKQILNALGEPVVLNALELCSSENVQRQIKNAGYEVDITTLTTIVKSITEQKFFEVAPAEYLPVKVGEGAWSASLTTYRAFSLADDFSTGVLGTGSNNSRMASADTQIDTITVPVVNWGKSIGWSLFDLQLASKSGNWDLVVSKERARKRNWDLGIQRVSFLGLKDDANVKGLITQSDVTVDTTVIPKLISSMTDAEFTTMAAAIYEAYRFNCNYTAKPTHFVIPERDYNGLCAPYSSTYPLKTKLQALEENFQMLTQNKSFKILPLAYGNIAIHGTVNKYALYNYEEDSLRIDIPVNYTNTLANSTDNFNFQNVGYGQFTGAKAYRPLEMLYFTNTVA